MATAEPCSPTAAACGPTSRRCLPGCRRHPDTSLPYLLPLALDVLRENPMAEEHMYAGDLLSAVLTRSPSLWAEFPELGRELRVIVSKLTARSARPLFPKAGVPHRTLAIRRPSIGRTFPESVGGSALALSTSSIRRTSVRPSPYARRELRGGRGPRCRS
ncbi:contact-dependent growth inhibition system immunity protein [Streptomyces adustus]